MHTAFIYFHHQCSHPPLLSVSRPRGKRVGCAVGPVVDRSPQLLRAALPRVVRHWRVQATADGAAVSGVAMIYTACSGSII